MIFWYGERGVVNAIVVHLTANNSGQHFLKCIQWADGKVPPWIAKVTEIKFLVELGLAHFGNPDLIMVCRCADEGQPRCVFIEAKIVPYISSAIKNQLGMRAPGFNSACNGQLSLKYRFAAALAAWNGNEARIVEPVSVHRAYRLAPEEGGLGDPKIEPRRLQKPQILMNMLRPHGLNGLPLENFSFVAMTWDREPFYRCKSDHLPRFLKNDGKDQFQQMASQVGWLGYQHLAGVPGLLDSISPALKTMVGSIEPTETDVTASTWRNLSPKSIIDMSQAMQQQLRSVEHIVVKIFGRDAVKAYSGSISIQTPSRVEGKIVPQEQYAESFILIGVRPEWPLADWSGLPTVELKIKDQPFRFVRLSRDPVDASTVVETVMLSLREALNEGLAH